MMSLCVTDDPPRGLGPEMGRQDRRLWLSAAATTSQAVVDFGVHTLQVSDKPWQLQCLEPQFKHVGVLTHLSLLS
jgi:hypothetical protein